MHIIIPKKLSKKVESFEQIKKMATDLQMMLEREDYMPKNAIKKTALALHHSQVDPEPFNFFVVKQELFKAKDNEVIVIVNPEIIEKDKSTREFSREGCASYPFRPDKRVQRCRKIKVKYQFPNSKGELETKEETISGMMAFIFQHEAEHAYGRDIYH